MKSRLGRMAKALAPILDAGAAAIAREIKAQRDPLTPVDTGALLASGRVERVGEGTWEFSEGKGLGDARAIYTEYGTDKQAAQPHVTPAVESVRPRAAGIMAIEVKKVIK